MQGLGNEHIEVRIEELDVPLKYQLGNLRIASQFLQSRKFQAFLSYLAGDRSKLADALVFLYLVHASDSIYRNMEESERIQLVTADGHVEDVPFVRTLPMQPAFKELAQFYVSVSLSPSVKLQRALQANVHRFIDEFSRIHVDDTESGDEALARIEIGKKLYKSSQEIEKMVDADKVTKVRSNYDPAMFEDPTTHKAAIR